MSLVENVSRRRFLGGLASMGGLVLAARVWPQQAWTTVSASTATSAAAGALHPSLYLGIHPDGTVYIVTHRSEMGTGVRTTLPMVAADELDADWDRVTIEQAIGDERYGDQNTDGSKSIRLFFDAFREAGASARYMLIAAAAARWNVPASECTTDLHEVVHRASGRRAGYGELAEEAGALPVPTRDRIQFKPRSAWRYMGQERPIYDLTDICTGAAIFGVDARRDGMVYAAIERPPVLGGRVRTVDDTEARQVAGVRDIVPIDTFAPPYAFQPLGGVAVIADNTWAAFQGRRRLKVTWDDGPHATHDSATFKQELFATVQQPGRVVRNKGDVDAEFGRGGTITEATYYAPMIAHAPMEPPVAIAEVRDGKVELWAPTQNPQAVQETVAGLLGVDKQDVTCHVTLLGGGFGRKAKADYVAEAAVLARKVGRPVKVVWSREDDIRFDYFHTVAAVYHKAALDARGRPTAWLHRSAFPPIAATFDEHARHGLNLEMGMGLNDLPFDVPHHRAENGAAEAHVRIGWFRAVANIYHVFASSSFADELAHAAGRDPLEFLLDLLGPDRVLDLGAEGVDDYWNYGAPYAEYPFDTARLRRVLEVAGQQPSWRNRRSASAGAPGGAVRRGVGIAASRSFNTYVASVVEVEVDERGRVRIPRVDQVVDAGIIVNPDRARSQFEGAAVMAASLALTGEITVSEGRVQQSNFHDYPVARLPDAPYETHVHLIESDAPPAGVGEPGVPPVVPALANAIFAATGRRIRELPLSKHDLT